jgi:hypothetical protein
MKRLKTHMGRMLEEAHLCHSADALKQATEILFEGTVAFHHPKLMLQTAALDREPLLPKLVRSLLNGLQK